MTYRQGLLSGILGTALVVGGIGAAWWQTAGPRKEAAKSTVPGVQATVPKTFKEDQGASVILTADSETKLAIRTAPVVRKPMPRKRVYGGEVIVPPGRSLIVSAPLAGTIRPGPIPVAGQAVKTGTPVLHLVPLLDPVGRANLTASRVDADGQVKGAEEQFKITRITFERAKEVLSGGAGRQRDVDDAQAAMEVAKQSLAAAIARRDLLAKVLGELESGGASPIALDPPANGVLRNVSALPGQTVPAGAPLFEVVNLDTVWVRVPVYVGDRDELDATAPAAVGSLSSRVGDVTRPAAVVSAPPTANPVTGTVDLFYSVSNSGAGEGTPYSPGQRVAVSVALKEPADALTIPWSAIVYDYHGGAWVYVKGADHAYSRVRVLVRYISGETAVLAEGPAPGKEVVIAGAAELFGTETGFSK